MCYETQIQMIQFCYMFCRIQTIRNHHSTWALKFPCIERDTEMDPVDRHFKQMTSTLRVDRHVEVRISYPPLLSKLII